MWRARTRERRRALLRGGADMTVLVLRALGIGDLATAVPALRGLRAARPTEEIALAAPAWLEPLAGLTGAGGRGVAAGGLSVAKIPGAKDPGRRWPVARFAEVARQLRRAGYDVVVTGSPAERALALRVAEGAGLPGDRVLAGRTDVGGLAALVAHARLVVCGDTGIA